MIILKPRLSEKSYAMSQKLHTYSFIVPVSCTRQQIKVAVEQQFKVSVDKVNIMNKPGKVKRSVRRRTQPITGRSAATKKAYVTLKRGDAIPLFEEA